MPPAVEWESLSRFSRAAVSLRRGGEGGELVQRSRIGWPDAGGGADEGLAREKADAVGRAAIEGGAAAVMDGRAWPRRAVLTSVFSNIQRFSCQAGNNVLHLF